MSEVTKYLLSSGKEIKGGPGVQFFYLTFVLDGVVLHIGLIGGEMTPVFVRFWASVCVCVCVRAPVYLRLTPLGQVHGTAAKLLSQADPWECREFLPDTPGHSAPAAPTHQLHAHTHTIHTRTQIHPHTRPSTPSFNPDIIDRHSPKSRHLALHAHTQTHTLGNGRESQGSAETL